MKSISRARAAKRAAAVFVAAAGLAAATGVSSASSAQAATGSYTVQYGTLAHWITASYDGMNVAVAGGATYAGAPVIQWYNTGGTEQKWYFDQAYDANGGFMGYMLRNENSNLCLFADTTAGDGMVQEPCVSDNPAELFWHYGSAGTANYFQVRNTGLYMDVSGNSYGAGAHIDAWYSNGGQNQTFWLTNVNS